jgi:hypothetical protein
MEREKLEQVVRLSEGAYTFTIGPVETSECVRGYQQWLRSPERGDLDQIETNLGNLLPTPSLEQCHFGAPFIEDLILAGNFVNKLPPGEDKKALLKIFAADFNEAYEMRRTIVFADSIVQLSPELLRLSNRINQRITGEPVGSTNVKKDFFNQPNSTKLGRIYDYVARGVFGATPREHVRESIHILAGHPLYEWPDIFQSLGPLDHGRYAINEGDRIVIARKGESINLGYGSPAQSDLKQSSIVHPMRFIPVHAFKEYERLTYDKLRACDVQAIREILA